MNINELIIQELLKKRIKNSVALSCLKKKISKKYKINCPSNVELLRAYHKLVRNKRIKSSRNLEELLKIRKVRSLSGIVIISVLTSPYPKWGQGKNLTCPGKCLYCPSQKGIPKSYLNNEPAVMRAVLNKFDPYLQIQTRLAALENTGHPTDKIELIIIGGSWSFLPKRYQTWFIKRCFDSCNKKTSLTLEEAQKINEREKHRIVGITIETRPDFINKEEIKRLRKLGVTRVELGVQSIYNDVLKLNKRGHTLEATIKATKLLKDAGFKICYHLMLNLPGSNLKRDEKMFEEIFSNPNFQPDLLKIYPTVVLKEAPLYKWWKGKKYQPYKDQNLINLLKSIKKKIPYYVRIQRLVRDIPSQSIVAGCKISNLRQVLAKELKKEGWQCRCIRCREVKGDYNPKEKVYFFRQDYPASGGREIFLSFENKKRTKLFSLLRMRIPSSIFSSAEARPPQIFRGLEKAAIIREIHTYGELVPISETKIAPQHRGLGKKLIREAEKIAKSEFDLKKVAVISGIGVRVYFRKLGYKLNNTYMIKKFSS